MANITLLEKYFPKTFDDLYLPTNVKNLLTNVMNQTGYNLLLFSSPGTGKTTTSRLLTIGHDKLYLSGSNDFNIETLRSKIVPFASQRSVLNRQKTVIIDEAENIRDNLQDAFKILFDQAKLINFIFITNEVDKINPAIKSRCCNIDYDFVGEDLKEQRKNFGIFMKKVCTAENISFDKDGLIAMRNLNFPDFRHLLVNLQEIKDKNLSVSAQYVTALTENGKQMPELYELIMNPSIIGQEMFKQITLFKGKEREAFMSLGEPFFQYLNDKGMFDKTIASAYIVSKHSSDFMNSINKFVTLYACVYELRDLFK